MCESVDKVLFRLTALPTLLARVGCDHSARELEAHLEEETALLSAEAEKLQRCAAALQARHRARSLVRDYERAVCRVLTRMCGGSACAWVAESFQQVEAAALLQPRSHLASAWERYKAAHPLTRFYDVCDALHDEDNGEGSGSGGADPDPGLMSLMAARLREEHCGLLPLCTLQGPSEAGCGSPRVPPEQRCVYERPPPKRRSFVERQQRRRRRKARHEARAACPQRSPAAACSETHADDAPQGELVPDDVLEWGEATRPPELLW